MLLWWDLGCCNYPDVPATTCRVVGGVFLRRFSILNFSTNLYRYSWLAFKLNSLEKEFTACSSLLRTILAHCQFHSGVNSSISWWPSKILLWQFVIMALLLIKQLSLKINAACPPLLNITVFFENHSVFLHRNFFSWYLFFKVFGSAFLGMFLSFLIRI